MRLTHQAIAIVAFFIVPGLLSFLSAFDCPADSARYPVLDTTSASYTDTLGTGLCACLDFGPSVVGTDSTVTLTVLLLENEPLRAFQFEVVDNTNNSLALRSVEAGSKIEGWTVPAAETSEGNAMVLGFSLAGEETEPGAEGTLVEITFDIVGTLGNSISFYLGGSGGVSLSNVDALNVACGYPDNEHPVSFPTDWLASTTPEEGIPAEYSLKQSFPNPFNPVTTIEFGLPSQELVRLSVYNILGQEVVTLVNEILPAGHHRMVWNGKNKLGRDVASGVYVYTLRTESFFDRKKMVLLR